ncbi:hypothetical protein KP509_32G027700 [Ceratopteris richardii]|uniref:Uncharacterized protein n=1 Tax=Ceratopteris richardii TaxID=49495 RepID=A0A8T2QSD4_CERRI|nr:hypothetical protein KP509_32G027700 [Ceratopteris richardii]KAH7286909.1 hypothetical protein KP509_32G027700 [Ceratopteris richardii]
MDFSSVKTLLEFPVVVIHKPSLLPKHTWISSIKVAVQHVEQGSPDVYAGKNLQPLRNTSNACDCTGILPVPKLTEDEEYAKGLIDRNNGIVEIGAGWPACQPKLSHMRIIWHHWKIPFDEMNFSKDQSARGPAYKFILLIGSRFVEAFNIYRQQRQRLMSLSVLPVDEQQVAYEIKLLLSHIIKDLQNQLQLNNVSTHADKEELFLIKIMNILVDLQLCDGPETNQLFWPPGNETLGVSGDCLRIMRHQVLSDLVTLVQSILSSRFPSNGRFEGRQKADVGVRIYYMHRAVLDIIELLSHLPDAGDLCSETYLEKELTAYLPNSNVKYNTGREEARKCAQEQMFQIQWKVLLAVLQKKDSASLENILCSICDEEKRRLVKIMAWSLGLAETWHFGGQSIWKDTGMFIQQHPKEKYLLEQASGSQLKLRENSHQESLKLECQQSAEEQSKAQELKYDSDQAYEDLRDYDVMDTQGAISNIQSKINGHAVDMGPTALHVNDLVESSVHTVQPEAISCTNQNMGCLKASVDCVDGEPVVDLVMDECQPEDIFPNNDIADLSSSLEASQIMNEASIEASLDSNTAADFLFSNMITSNQTIFWSDVDGDDEFHNAAETSRVWCRKRRNPKTRHLKEYDYLPCSAHSLRKSHLSLRKFWLALAVVFIIGAIVIGILWIHPGFSILIRKIGPRDLPH